jgi:hypothetical protein
MSLYLDGTHNSLRVAMSLLERHVQHSAGSHVTASRQNAQQSACSHVIACGPHAQQSACSGTRTASTTVCG